MTLSAAGTQQQQKQERRRRIAVIGGGWAGLAAAVQSCSNGHAVTVFEMAPQFGGRARRVVAGDYLFDNGQHILLGAYTQTLALLDRVGVDASRCIQRLPLRLRHADGSGLALPAGAPVNAFVRGVLAIEGWTWRERLALLRAAAGWAGRGFRCNPALSVAALTAALPRRVIDELIDPLCVAALNTPARDASASVFLRVLHDALFAGPGGSDLLLPRVDLSALWPDAAERFLRGHGATCHLASRVMSLAQQGAGWNVDAQPFDAVVMATTATEAARLAEPHAAAWAGRTARLRHEPIVTVLAQGFGARLPEPMLALRPGPEAPAQFVFDLGRLRGMDGVLAFVVSGAAGWVARGLDATAAAVLRQAGDALPAQAPAGLALLRVYAEKRATFSCTPGLDRPPAAVAPGLVAAGDYVDGPYPATLEGAMRSGLRAAELVAQTAAPTKS